MEGAGLNNNNAPKRTVVNIYDPTKIPRYGREYISEEWNGLIRQQVPRDVEMMFFFSSKVYDLVICRIRNNTGTTDYDELMRVNTLKISMQRMISTSKSDELRNYNQTCSGGKLCLMSCIFISILALNQYILMSINSNMRTSKEEYDAAFEWAYKHKLVLLDKDSEETWTQMTIFLQTQTLATNWPTLKRGHSNEAFYFVSIIEDRLSTILTLVHDSSVIDGYGKEWTRMVSELVLPSIEFIDDMANVFVGFYRSMFTFERVSKFTRTDLPEGRILRYLDGFKAWLQQEMYESVLSDYIDDARANGIYYCVREGENERAIREKNGVRSKSIKWSLHVSRCYKQITWMLQEHTYDRKGNVLKSLPRPWQVHCLKMNVFINFMGSYGLHLTDLTFIQEKYFWDKLAQKDILKNPFIVEIMGEHFLIHSGCYYQVDNFEEVMLLWFIIMHDKCKGIYKNSIKVLDLQTTIAAYLRQWDSIGEQVVNGLDGVITEDRDVIV